MTVHMADMGYSSDYAVYLTENNGVQIVVNFLSLSILKELRLRELSPSEISVTLDVPKSTIQGNINKLIRMGIVAQDTRIDDTRSVVYHISAMQLFSSESDIEWQLSARSASVTRIMRVGRCTSAEDISLYGVSLTESGLNIVQGLFNVGAALVKDKDDLGWWNDLFNQIDKQSGKHGISVQMNTDDGLRLRFESKTEDISDISMVMFPMLGAVIYNSKNIFGYHLAHDASLKVSNNGFVVELHVPRFEGQDFENRLDIKRGRSSFKIDEQFSVYSIDGTAVLFTNPTMMAILDCLSESDLSLGDLERSTGLSKATVYAALTKLIGIGAVDSVKNRGEMMKYTLEADPILYTTRETNDDFDKMDDVVLKFHKGEIDYYSAVTSYAMLAIGCMGIHFDKMFIRSGRNAALSVIEADPDIQPQELVELSCAMVSSPDKAEIRTYIPLCIDVTLSQKSLWESWPGDFVMGFLSEGLKRLIGTGYKISVIVNKEGEPEPVTILES